MSYSVEQIIEKRRRLWDKHHDEGLDREFIRVAADEIVSSEDNRKVVRERPWLLIEACFTVVTKEGKTVPFFFNEVQRDFIRQIEENGASKHKPYLILKGRQLGFTTMITAIANARSITKRNFFGLTVADCGDNTRSIFNDKARSVYDRLPPRLKPTEKFNSAKELFFSKLNSSWRAATASENVARSKTLSMVHYSEAAFYKCNLSSLQASVGAACVDDALIVYESTPNGFNEFKDLWDSGTCINLFYPWWLDKEYRCTDYHYIDRADAWLKERIKLLEEKGLDREQIAWYCRTYDGYIDKRLIRQEYPCSPEEAFISTGGCVFDLDKLNDQMIRVGMRPGPIVGEFVYDRVLEPIKGPSGAVVGTRPILKNVRFLERAGGCIRIHAEPRVKRDERGEVIALAPYVLGGDTAGEGSDCFTAKIIDNMTGATVATLQRKRMDADLYAEQLYCLGKHYHEALLGVEINFTPTPMQHLLNLGYSNIYYREVVSTSMINEATTVPGFQTDHNSREGILDNLVRQLRDDPSCEVDMETLRELTTFIRNPKKLGRREAMAGAHDDLVMALAIAHFIRGRQSRDWLPVPEEENTFIKDNFHVGRKKTGGAFMDWGD
ncbi:MAG: hypothetical protein IKC97_01795 [Clostridia bacterium]|nr:hypothetical protein [Clostridia bacterium]